MAHVLTVGGVDITDDVEFTKSNFVSLVNGQPGTCLITIRDPGRTLSFSIGARILLTIDGLNVWAGYLMRQRRVYPFRANSPSGIRLFELVGLDINVLFTKRFVYKQSDPTADRKIYPGGTLDTTALTELFANWIDLSGDNLDTSSLVTSVGPMTPSGQDAFPFAPGQSWAVTMTTIGRMLAPVWYLNPDRKLVWGDVDAEDAPYTLTDNPSSDPLDLEVGYQNFTLMRDGTQLTNDVLFVGAGNGDSKLVYRRLQDHPSMLTHGRWQDGGLVQGVWKQDTIDQVASSYVYGSPYSRRGRKDDKTIILCTTFTDGFRAGQKVQVVCGPWGYNDVIPIRQMRITWPVPFEPKYDLMLSHDLDTPYNLFDPYDYGADSVPVVPVPSVPKPNPPKPPDWRDYLGFFVESGQACDPIEPNNYDYLTNSFQHWIWWVPDEDGTQYNFETYNRADQDGWGTSTDGHAWKNYKGTAYPQNYFDSDIVSNRGEQIVDPPGIGISAPREGDITELGGPWSTEKSVVTWAWHSHYDDTENTLGRAYWYRFGLRDEYASIGYEPWWIQVTWNGTGEGTVCDSDGNCAPINVGPPGTENTGRTEITLGDDGSVTHETCLGTVCISNGGTDIGEDKTSDSCCGDTQQPGSGVVSTVGTIIDDFNRTGTGWGSTSGTGDAWASSSPTANITVSTSGSAGVITIAPNTYPYNTLKTVSLNEGGTTVSGGITGTGVPDILFTGDVISCSIDVKVEGDPGAYVEITWAEGADTADAGISLGLAYPDQGFNPRLYFDSVDDTQKTIYYSLAVDVWFRVTFTISGSQGQFTIVNLSNPSSTASGSVEITPPPWHPGQFTIMCVGDLSATSHTFSFDNLTGGALAGSTGGDTFDDRTLTGTWGPASGGGVWSSYSQNASNTLSVHDGSGFFGAEYDDNSQALIPFVAPTFTIEADIVWNWGTGSGRELLFGVLDTSSYTPNNVYDGYMSLWQTFGGVWYLDVMGDDIYETTYTPTDNQVYTWKLEYDGSTLTGSLISSGTVVATVSGAWTSGTVGTHKGIFINCYPKYLGGDSPVELKELRTGSGGSPAGWDEQGPCFWIDDFAGRTETGAWGTGDYGTWTSHAYGGTIIGVENGAAYVEIPGTVTINYSGGGRLSDTTGPWNTQFFTWCGEFIVTANQLNSYNITWGIHGQDGNFDRYVFEGSVLWDYNTAPTTNVPFQIVGGQAYTWRWEYGLGINRLRAWKSGDPEPTSWTINPGAVTEWPLVELGAGSYPYMTISSIGAAANRAYRVDIPWVSFSRCNPSNKDAENAVGWVCEDFGGGTQAFYVSNNYTPTTVRVYLNGLVQSDFTEEGGNKVLLGFITSVSDQIKVCYMTAGYGDGWSDTGPGGPYPV